MERFSREITLIGKNNFQKLSSATVAIFGVGGVGGYVCEALARCGISNFRIYDYDVVSLSNVNRQIIALDSTIGQKKVEVMKRRMLDINPNSVVECFDIRVDQDNIESIDFSDVDYIVDAIDMVTSKVLLIEKATKQSKKIISCMGTGNKFEPTMLEFANITKTQMCPLAKVMRKLLKEKGIEKLEVLYSKEQPQKIEQRTPASVMFVPSVAGIMIAQKIFKDILEM